jgi:hypothetical protein
VTNRTKNNAPTWPEALALACPKCDEVFPLSGVRSDGGLLFRCLRHGWVAADSWTAEPFLVNTHTADNRTVDPDVRRDFITSAIGVLLRAGAPMDNLILQSAVPDDSMQFVLVDGGDGGVAAQVSSRRNPCERCAPRPLDGAHEKVLFDLGFEALGADENYFVDSLPAHPDELTAAAEVIFRDAFEEIPGTSVWAIFNKPYMAEACYLGWSFAPWR